MIEVVRAGLLNDGRRQHHPRPVHLETNIDGALLACGAEPFALIGVMLCSNRRRTGAPAVTTTTVADKPRERINIKEVVK
ncbi:hypothetical protein [Sphingopyxis terrae]|uniref:hypothetical protein n=1 Tax=Sphingopyxis terrae TaxID=33052 RepID=UPI0020D20D6A|nr:hypothetical protein [Sphingopyxis terrae]